MNLHVPGLRPLHALNLRTRRRRHGAFGSTARATVTAMISDVGRLFEAFINRLMRNRMKRALHAMSDRLLADIGVSRGGIDAAVDEFVPRPSRRAAH